MNLFVTVLRMASAALMFFGLQQFLGGDTMAGIFVDVNAIFVWLYANACEYS